MSINKLDETLSNLDLDTAARELKDRVISKSMNNLKEKMSGLDIQVEKTKNEVKVESKENVYEGDRTKLADTARKVYRANINPVDKDAVEGIDYNLENIIWMWDKTTIADKKIIEDNQKGVNSKKYIPGPLSEMEKGLEKFKKWYLKTLLKSLK